MLSYLNLLRWRGLGRWGPVPQPNQLRDDPTLNAKCSRQCHVISNSRLFTENLTPRENCLCPLRWLCRLSLTPQHLTLLFGKPFSKIQ
ncbi:hypothetical protein Pelo_1070 [Pelomyxa schiedti]|nr:hypothetical protein Pelo_1070 [Pelomyxa schiedti]